MSDISVDADPPQPQPNQGGRPRGRRNSDALSKHATGQYYKTIHGHTFYFGSNYHEALARYREEGPALRGSLGHRNQYDPRRPMKDVINLFLDEQKREVKGKQKKFRSYLSDQSRLRVFAKYLGEGAQVRDVDTDTLTAWRGQLLEDGYKPKYINGLLQPVKAVIVWARKKRFVLQVHEGGPDEEDVKWCIVPDVERQTFTAEQFRKLVDAATGPLKAMILLGLNAGFGCTDCAEVAWKHFDLDDAFVSFPRPKTGVARDFTLWPDTVAALRALPVRSDLGPLVFYTGQGHPWVRPNPSGKGMNDEITKAFPKLAKRAGVKLEPGNSFYALRRTAATIAAETGDAFAVMRILGHKDLTQATKYVQNRHRKCVNAIRALEHLQNWYKNEPAYLCETQVVLQGAEGSQ